MKFPYGLSDFGTLRREGYWYQDRSDRIAQLEAAGRQLIFLRPRRFGKSLLLSMLEHYYDLKCADEFDALFGELAIGQAPTPLHNQFYIMKWDFSLVPAHGEVDAIEAALHRHLNGAIHACLSRYGWLGEVKLVAEDAIASLTALLTQIRTTPHKLYLLIDEPD